jgi:hypothetical protein
MSGILTVEAKNLATDRGLSARPFAALLGVLVAATCSDVLLGWSTFFFRDFGFFGYPLAIYHRTCFWRGEWPLWNPLNNLGIPFLAQWNTMTLYPGSLFYLLFPLPWSLSVFCLLHQYWGGIGMYFLARRWTGNTWAAAWAGLIFAFNGLMLNCLMWPNNIAALGWMRGTGLDGGRAATDQGGVDRRPANADGRAGIYSTDLGHGRDCGSGPHGAIA